MGMLKRRLMITTHGFLRGWRRVHPDRMAYSGQLQTKVSNKYFSFIEFDIVKFYPGLRGHWEDHYLGEKDGVFIVMLMKDMSGSVGPLL